MPIMDCDEVYNYWEPLHYLSYGSGMQTWEYAPQYALRTYVYLLPLYGVTKLLDRLPSWLVISTAQQLLLSSTATTVPHYRLAVFVILRSLLAATTAYGEVSLLRSMSAPVQFADSLHRVQLLPSHMTFTAAALLLTSTGMTHAAGALLPSSTILSLWTLAAGCYIQHRFRLFCVIAVTATLAVGWPFGVAVFVSMGIHVLTLTPRPVLLLLETLLYSVVLQCAIMAYDATQYGQFPLSATYNIFRYNAQSGGDELYGVEPASYYGKNLLLNWNYIAPLGLSFLPLSFVLRMLGRPFPTSLIVVLAGTIYPWLSLVVPRPHKEERFLFPIYPALCIAAVVVTEGLWRVLSALFLILWPSKQKTTTPSSSNTHKSASPFPYWTLLLVPAILLSVSRSVALSKYYTAPLHLYRAIPASTTTSKTVCVGGEWYRFPSSYHLPEKTSLGFLPSSFKGQLPKPFEAKVGSRGGTNFNDQNKQELDRYVSTRDCDYLIELRGQSDDTGNAESLPSLQNDDEWKELLSVPFLDASSTPTLHRTLYIPYLHEKASQYQSYTLWERQSTTTA